ncbi:hypothetical protein Dimus_038878 [Dionaea muscipula]
MHPQDKSWMSHPRWSDAYNDGVLDFLVKAFAKSAQGNEICCPCKKCIFCNWYQKDVVCDHLIAFGFTAGYYE